MLYGLYPRPELEKKIGLRPAMSVHSRIIFLKRIEKGKKHQLWPDVHRPAAYDGRHVADCYSDGYLRGLSGKADVLAGGKRCPVLVL